MNSNDHRWNWNQMLTCGSIMKQAASTCHLHIFTLYSLRYQQNQFVLHTSCLCEEINLSSAVPSSSHQTHQGHQEGHSDALCCCVGLLTAQIGTD